MSTPGRPTARRTIVDNVIPSANLNGEFLLLRDIHHITVDTNQTIQWLANHGLLSNSEICCNKEMGYVNRGRNSDRKAWYCKICKKHRSIRVKGFFLQYASKEVGVCPVRFQGDLSRTISTTCDKS